MQGKDMPWAKKGYVQMEEQLRVKGADVKAPAIKQVAATNKAAVKMNKTAKALTLAVMAST